MAEKKEKRKDPLAPWIERQGMALVTDLYQLTMMAGYVANNMQDRPAAFEYFFRNLPPHTGFAVFAGLEQALKGLEGMRFTDSDMEYLEGLGIFGDDALDYFREFVMDVDMWAMPEGTLVFPNEPIVRVEGKLGPAQLVETFILNCLNYPTLIATKASRVVNAADGEPVLEFGLRRAHGPDGGLIGARAAYIGGCAGTSNVLAGKAFGIPVKGTHAHSWVMSHDTELEAFRNYAKAFPESCILLVDTYDTLECGMPNAIEVFKELREKHPDIRAAVRLDSGDLAKLSKGAFKQLREAGFEDPMIVASGDLEEDLIADMKRQGAKINAWGVGTHLITSRDHPSLGGVYKVVGIKDGDEWDPRLKVASNVEKTTDPGRKQVARLYNQGGAPIADVLYMADEELPESGEIRAFDRQRFHEDHAFRAHKVESMLKKHMEGGKVIVEHPSLDEIRKRAEDGISHLAEEMKRLRNPEYYPVVLSPALSEAKKNLIKAAENKCGLGQADVSNKSADQ